MVNWLCSICGKQANYHSCTNGFHIFYCNEHWWEYVKAGYVVQDLGSIDVSIVKDAGAIE